MTLKGDRKGAAKRAVEILDLFLTQGKSPKEIAAKIDMNYYSVCLVLRKYNVRSQKKNCEVCGKIFNTFRSQRIYCSRTCRNKVSALNARRKRAKAKLATNTH